jgi:ketosteroid isomerase-like protein
MQQNNLEKVQQIYDAFRQRDISAIFSLISTDIEVIQSTQLPWGGHYRGHDGLRKFLETLIRHVSSSLAIDRYLDAGESVVAIGRTHGTVVANGHPFDVPIAHVWQFRDDLIVRFMPYIDNPTMLKSLV